MQHHRGQKWAALAIKPPEFDNGNISIIGGLKILSHLFFQAESIPHTHQIFLGSLTDISLSVHMMHILTENNCLRSPNVEE